jgi:carboxyl-terminal processing protease
VTETLIPESVKLGWEVLQTNGAELPPLVAKLQADPAVHELQLERAIAARLSGPIAAVRPMTFADAANARVTRDVKLIPPRGTFAGFGNLPAQPVFFESKMLGNTGYIRFNMFLDLVRVMTEFGDAVQKCAHCDGIVIDLRGNPGGIGGMAMGMAGWLVSQPGLRLGTMYMRGATLNFAINPRTEAYGGPVAVLVDGSSASTSEIFAGGLKDLGRARIFGTRTAAAALPSVITRLPNGDGFQYAVANYVSQGGQALEGNGVIPDVEVKLTREALLAGHDSVVDAALDWIRKQKESK